MAVLDQLNLNLGTEQNPNWVLHDLRDKRISTTAVTTATHLLATNAGVTAMNPITAANLASVLGASKSYESDMNNLISTGLYVCGYNATNKPTTGVPYYVEVQKYIIGNQNVIRQIAGRSGAGGVYERWFSDNAWSSWKVCEYDIPSFYKDYSTLASLASGLSTSLVAGFKSVTSAITNISELGNGIFFVGNASHVPGIPSEYASHAIAIIRFPVGQSKGTIVIDLEGTVGIYTRFIDNGTFYKQ